MNMYLRKIRRIKSTMDKIPEKELLTSDIMGRIKELGYQNTANPIMVAKFVNPSGPGAWYVSDFTPNLHTVTMYYMDEDPEKDEWIDMFVAEFQAMRCPPYGLPVERDTGFTEREFLELEKERTLSSLRKAVQSMSAGDNASRKTMKWKSLMVANLPQWVAKPGKFPNDSPKTSQKHQTPAKN